MGQNSWSAAEESRLLELYSTLNTAKVADMLNAEFGNGRTDKAVSSRAKRLRIRKVDGFQRNPRKMWPDEKREWFRSFVPGHTEAEISAEHERLYGFPLTEAQIGNAKTSFGVRSGTHGGRFEKGAPAWNKGKKWDEYVSPEGQEASRLTCFKKGEVNGRAAAIMKPVGTERVNKDGYVEVKVSTGLQERANSNFRLKHRVEYEKAHGPVPSGCNVVFANHDRRDFSPENLVAVPRDLWSVITRRRLEYWDAESLVVAMNVARLDKARNAAQCRPRSCKRCGAEFRPRYARQRTCDACLGR